MPSGMAITAAIAIDGGGTVHGLDEIDAERAAAHALPQRLKVAAGDGSSTGSTHCRRPPAYQSASRPTTPTSGRNGSSLRPHVRRTSRWNTSRQCALVRTNSGSDSVASVRGRADVTAGKSATRAGWRDSSSTRSAR